VCDVKTGACRKKQDEKGREGEEKKHHQMPSVSRARKHAKPLQIFYFSSAAGKQKKIKCRDFLLQIPNPFPKNANRNFCA